MMIRLICTFFACLFLFSNGPFAQQLQSDYDAASSAYQIGNYVEAEALWSELAESNDANAQYALGIMHLRREAQKSTDKKAFGYFVDAAKQQHLASIFNLGVAYWEGRGVRRQPEKAMNWWEIAAERQDAGAQYNLGLGYYIGQGRKQDNNKAGYWIQQAADNHHPQAKTMLTKLSADQAITAQGYKEDIIPASIEPKPATDLNASAGSESPLLSPVESEPVLLMAKKKPAPAALTEPEPNQAEAPESNTQRTKQLTALRAAPNATSISLMSLKSGTSLKILQSRPDWSKVLVLDSYPVWVYETFLKDQGDGIGIIKGSNVNIRPQPSTDKLASPALGQLSDGDIVSLVLKRSPWIQILPAQPFPAWVATRDIK